MSNLTIKFRMHLSEKGKERIEAAKRKGDFDSKELTELERIASSPEHIVLLNGTVVYRIHESGFEFGEKRGTETVPEELRKILSKRLPKPQVELEFDCGETTDYQRINNMVSGREIKSMVDFYNLVAESFCEKR